MKIIVTGSSGFLGSHLTEHLSKNNEILTISKKKDRFSKNIGRDILTIKKIPSDVDCILHLAALTDVQLCQNNPKKCFEVNVVGTQNVLELARKSDCKFIIPTSSLIFGKPEKLPLNENSPLNPMTIHGASKAACEIICKSYSNQYGMDITATRLFSIYGPDNPPYSIIHRIIFQLLQNRKIILGNTLAKRDFLYITDLLKAFDLIIQSKDSGFKQFNIGSGKSHSIESICNKLLKISSKNLPVQIDKKLIRKNDVQNLVSDSSKLKKLNWSPKIPLYTGLKLTYDWYSKKSKHS